MPTWDKGRPVGAEPWSSGGGRIRDNFSFLEDTLKHLFTFAMDPSNPTNELYGKISYGLLADRPLLADVRQTGVLYAATDNGRVYLCTDGALDTWVDVLSSLGGALSVAGLITAQAGLTVSAGTLTAGAATLSGLLSANLGIALAGANMSVAATRKIVGPAGESWLQEGGDVMRPHLHGAARHRLTGADGAWVQALDPLKYLIQDIQYNSDATAAEMGLAYTSRVSISRNFTGRSATTKVLALGVLNSNSDNSSDDDEYSARITKNSGTVGSVGAVSRSGTEFGLASSAFVFEYFENVAAGATTFEIQDRYDGASGAGGRANYHSSHLLILDLGNA